MARREHGGGARLTESRRRPGAALAFALAAAGCEPTAPPPPRGGPSQGFVLQVANLPENRLAFNNRVYLSPHNLAALKAAMPPESSGSLPLITVGPHPYAADAHPGGSRNAFYQMCRGTSQSNCRAHAFATAIDALRSTIPLGRDERSKKDDDSASVLRWRRFV